MIALSTAYHIKRHDSWSSLLAHTRAMGFSSLELNVEFPSDWMQAACRAVSAGEITVSSLHNYCPRIDDLPAGRTVYSGYLLTADSPHERQLALEHTLATIRWANVLAARVVVVHAGEIPTEPTGRELMHGIGQRGAAGSGSDSIVRSILSQRRMTAPRYFDRLVQALDVLVPAARSAGVIVGLENRYFLNEMPDIRETAQLLARYPDGSVGYWHDTGHAQIFIRLGAAVSQHEFLEPFRGKIAGMHLHDVSGFSDHRVPGSGELDFSEIARYLGPGSVRVMEVHTAFSDAELIAGRVFLNNQGID